MRRRLFQLALAVLFLHGCATVRREGPSKREKEMTVTAYAYHSTKAQTDGRPRETASGHDLEPGMKAIAVSRDLEELGLIVSPVCLFFVSVIKNKLGYDDSLDVFGVHCIGGIIGAIATGILVNPALGGAGIVDYTAGGAAVYPGTAVQVMSQLKGVLTTICWSGIGSLIVFGLIKMTIGLRVKEEVEREGLDIGEHGERAYNM